jgi:nicotinamidase-related amidase
VTTICWDVDTQVDFIHHNGALAVPGAEPVLPHLATLSAWARRTGVRVVATADDHDIGHAEISGQTKVAATTLRDPLVIQPVPIEVAWLNGAIQAHRGELLLNKPGVDVFRWNPNAATVLEALAPTRIIIYGVATDFCVKAAVEGLARHAPAAELVIVRDAIRAIDDATGRALLVEWAARGFTITDTVEVVT